MSITYILQDPTRVMSMESYVSGRDRPLYFKRPLVTSIQEAPVQLSPPPIKEEAKDQALLKEEEKLLEPKTKNALTQTDFRDSEAQTDPYTPDFVIRDGENPEVLSLKHLKYGQGLPASIDELDSIEQNREKVWFDNGLPPISDEASFMLRRRLMEDQEVKEWNNKENEIKRVQNEKLYLLQSALIEREKDTEEKNAQRIEEIKIKKTEQKNRLIAKIQRRKIKVLRKLIKRRKEIDNDKRKREIIEEYANFGSKVYAGITREGLSLDKIANKYEVQPVALTTFKGITELANSLKPSYFETKINVKKIQDSIMAKYTRGEIFHKGELKKAQEEIDGKRAKKKKVGEETKDYNNQFSLNKVRVRPDTPVYNYDNEFDSMEMNKNFKLKAEKFASYEKRELAIILIQRLLKGRATQNIMYEGKEKRLALIEELLTVAKIPDLPENEKEEILLAQHEEKVKNALLEGIQGGIMSETLDILAKELLRMQQEKRISEMVEKAEQDRKIREIEESGRRQAEETLREREDVLYNEMIRLHQGTVDNYLSWIMNNTIEKASTRQAVIMSKLRKEKMSKAVENLERKINNKETIIKDLVSSFLIPNIERTKLQKTIELEEKRFAEAAKKSLNATLTQMTEKIQEKK